MLPAQPAAVADGLMVYSGAGLRARLSTWPARTVMTEPESESPPLADALDILSRLARQAGVPAERAAWRERILWLAFCLRTEDAMHAELSVPASERRRDLRRVADRLERQARGGRRWGTCIAMLDATVLDVQKVWSDFDKDMLAKVASPEDAAGVAARLRRVDDALDRSVYGRAAGPTRPDFPLIMAAAGLADLIQEACGKAQRQSPSVSPGSPWALLLQRVSEIAGRPVKEGARDLSHALKMARSYAKVEPVPIRISDTPPEMVFGRPEPRPPRAVRPRRGKPG